MFSPSRPLTFQLVEDNRTLKNERSGHLGEIDAYSEERQKLKLQLNEANERLQAMSVTSDAVDNAR